MGGTLKEARLPTHRHTVKPRQTLSWLGVGSYGVMINPALAPQEAGQVHRLCHKSGPDSLNRPGWYRLGF